MVFAHLPSIIPLYKYNGCVWVPPSGCARCTGSTETDGGLGRVEGVGLSETDGGVGKVQRVGGGGGITLGALDALR